ncbi:hypothetical protein LS74_002245 [Helicobacter magdeburgensis]|uniref:Uncharacterized protein n=1 Tax=Helicobacter magdeburgensis TaxID=471858 RepID=A0A4U8T4T4_9HELI|nr:hypothetical protein [Helicobacter magdeburgensis]TLD93557.1 hypothetical protein LS74_002245 [Helicobacter magdeburgensis]
MDFVVRLSVVLLPLFIGWSSIVEDRTSREFFPIVVFILSWIVFVYVVNILCDIRDNTKK